MRKLLFICLLSFPVFVFGQIKHEIKLNSIGIITGRAYDFNYEYLTSDKRGLMLNLSTYSYNRYTIVPDSLGSDFDFQESNFQIRIGRNYYKDGHFSKGFQWGYYVYASFKIGEDQNAVEKYQTIFNLTPEFNYFSFGVGSLLGYRFLIGEKIIILPSGFFDMGLEFFRADHLVNATPRQRRPPAQLLFAMYPKLMIGYRF